MKLFDYFSQRRERKNLGNCSLHCPTTVRPVHIIPAYATKSVHVASPGIVVAITPTRLHEQVLEPIPRPKDVVLMRNKVKFAE